jgi:40-residue YVTN family beta-propeller repeat
MTFTTRLVLTTALLVTPLLPVFAQSGVVKSAKVEAKGLYEIVFNETENAVYVASAGARGQGQGKVLKLDPKTLAVTGAIDVAAEPPYGMGLNQTTQTLYTTNTVTGSVSAIDLKTKKPTYIRKEGEKPHFRAVVVDEGADLAYVSIVAENSSVWVIDGAKKELSHVIENVGRTATGMALDAPAKRLYVTAMGENAVHVIDLAEKKVVARYPAGGERPVNLVRNAKAGRLFVACQGSGDVTVLEAATGKLLKTIQTGKGALGVGYDPGKSRLYVANRGDGTVTVINADTYAVLAIHKTGTHPNTVAIDRRTGAAYVTNKAGRSQDGSDDPAGDTVTLIAP